MRRKKTLLYKHTSPFRMVAVFWGIVDKSNWHIQKKQQDDKKDVCVFSSLGHMLIPSVHLWIHEYAHPEATFLAASRNSLFSTGTVPTSFLRLLTPITRGWAALPGPIPPSLWQRPCISQGEWNSGLSMLGSSCVTRQSEDMQGVRRPTWGPLVCRPQWCH